MKLLEALSIIKSGDSVGGPTFRVLLATGFTQLPLETLFKAHLCLCAPKRRICVEGGLFGDLAGNLERAGTVDAVAVVMEWEDLDARLGVRTLGGWTVAALPDILRSARLQIARIAAALESMAAPVVVSLPSIPFPPIVYSLPRQFSRLEAELRASLQQLAAEAGSNVSVLNPYELDRISPASARFDLQSAIASGFPYVLSHADALASLLAGLLIRHAPKKGLITDLDDTLWAGILGEAGISGVCWDLDGKAQIHGLYQQFLASLASAGVLIGVASKNDRKLVDKLFAERQDLLLPVQSVFPVEANWRPKSASVANILQDWNIGARDVVFLDDSPMEAAEVQAVFPEMECVVFPKKNPSEFWDLLHRLRETFAKSSVSAEDELRLTSIRAASEFRQEAVSGSVSERFLSGVEAEISVSRDKEPDARAFELINKTNQFNLNGLRLTESEWNTLISNPESFLFKQVYRDRFGPLGSIAVMAGRRDGRQLAVEHWVMSCRAFSRRIEYQALKLLFESYKVDEVLLSYKPTPYNGPLREFLESLLGPVTEGTLRLDRGQFEKKCPALYHSVKDATVQNSTTAPA
jgi:FkbH-like protein